MVVKIELWPVRSWITVTSTPASSRWVAKQRDRRTCVAHGPSSPCGPPTRPVGYRGSRSRNTRWFAYSIDSQTGSPRGYPARACRVVLVLHGRLSRRPSVEDPHVGLGLGRSPGFGEHMHGGLVTTHHWAGPDVLAEQFDHRPAVLGHLQGPATQGGARQFDPDALELLGLAIKRDGGGKLCCEHGGQLWLFPWGSGTRAVGR